jgi:hypothetical protein
MEQSNIKPIHFITYGNHVFEKSKLRLVNQAKHFYPFKSISGCGPADLPRDFTEKFKNILDMKRIAGYGIWRPIILKQKLEQIDENEFLIYLDAGCNINNNAIKRFNEYIDLLDKSEYGMISFQMSGNKNPKDFQKEKWWTTKEIFNYFNVIPDSNIGNSAQYLDGILIMKKNKHLMNLIDLWIKSVYDNPIMFTDYYNNSKQHPDFKENRHEQSVFSLIRKINGSLILDDETWFIPFGNEDSLKYPFWASRTKN